MKIDVLSLPEKVRQELLKEYIERRDAAKTRKEELLQQLEPVEEEINAYSQLVNAFQSSGLPIPKAPASLTSEKNKYDGQYDVTEPYNPNWSHAQKVKYVADRPQKYGAKTLKGSGGIVDAILKEQPDWLNEMPNSATGPRGTLIGKIAPIISRMVDPDNRQLIKLRTKGTKNEFHFISADWFIDKDETKVKPEYAEAVAGLEPIPSEKKLAPAGAGASAESDTDLGEKPSGDAAEKLNGQSYGLLSDSYTH